MDGVFYYGVTEGAVERGMATEGTLETTRQVLDAPIRQAVALGNRAMIESRGTGDLGDEESKLWLSDGSAQGTVAVDGFDALLSSSDPRGFLKWGERLAFTTGPSYLQRSVWSTDGQVSDLLLDDRRLGRMAASDEHLYVYDSGLQGVRAFSAAGSDQLISFDAREPGEMIRWQDRVFVSLYGSTGQQLWSTAGSQSETLLVTDIFPDWFYVCPLTCYPPVVPRDLTPVAGRLVFSAFSDEFGPAQLWATSGEPGSAELLAEFSLAGGSWAFDHMPRDMTSIGDLAFFRASDPEHGEQLWVTDGTLLGTVRLTESPSGPVAGQLTHLTPWGSRLVMVERSEKGDRLWWSDGGPPQLVPAALPAGTRIGRLAADAKRLYWTAATVETGSELWVSNGTAKGTHLLDLYPGARTSGVRSMSAGVQGLFFAADAGNGTGHEPWFLPHGSLQPVQLADLAPGREPSSPGDSLLVGNDLFFGAAGVDGKGHELGRELYAFDIRRARRDACLSDRPCGLEARRGLSRGRE